MGNDGDLITLVVHTEERALRLKEILEFHDIPVRLEDVELPGIPLQIAPKKVRIPIASLALGLKILESGDANSTPPFYIAPLFTSPEVTGEDIDDISDSELEAVEALNLRKVAASQLSKFKADVAKAVSDGGLPDKNFLLPCLREFPSR